MTTNRHLALACLLLIVLCPTGASLAEDASSLSGKKLFIRCKACHVLTPQERQLAGPHLQGIVGRQAGSLEGFAYGESLAGKTFAWDEAQLDQWLQQPQSVVPGMCLPFFGLRKAEERQALIEYLKRPGDQ